MKPTNPKSIANLSPRGLLLLLLVFLPLPCDCSSFAQTLLNRNSDPRAITLHSGDMVSIQVFEEPDLSTTSRVSSQGKLDVRLVGAISVAGRTPEEAAAEVEKQFRDNNYLKAPHVSLLITEYAAGAVSVLGEVKKPGVYQMMGNHTLLDAISTAGGLTPTANSTVTIKRRSGDHEVVTVHLHTENAQTSIDNDVPIYPDDLVIVPRVGVVYVLGDVGKPGGFTMPSSGSFTVLEAVSEAQGTAKTASTGSIKLLRKEDDGKVDAIDIPLKKMQSGSAKDVALLPDDVLYIPASALKSSAVTLAGLGGAVATAAIYSTH